MTTADFTRGGGEPVSGMVPQLATAETGSGYAVSKLLLDVVTAGVLLTLLLPVLALLAVAVRVDSRGPALFRQVRLGLNGRPFTMFKFRSMHVDADDTLHRDYIARLMDEDRAADGGEAGVYKLCTDPRVTRVGRFLRRTSLDELPQLVNVLTGRMSLVGPRPALDWEVALYQPAYRRRLMAKPGLTGLWQISGRSTLTLRQALELDLEYLDRRSFWFDLRILARTPLSLLRRTAR